MQKVRALPLLFVVANSKRVLVVCLVLCGRAAASGRHVHDL